jgi:dTDP-4-amino-4,6-dideoxygalactose transaminase
MIPIAKPLIGQEEIDAVTEVLQSGIIAEGPKVREFENAFAKYTGTDFAVAVNSGTAALHVALMAHDIGPGDDVITTPFSFIATGNSIKYVGATPVFCDIGNDYNIDVAKIEEKITPKTKAIIAVHLFGLPCDMKELNDLVEDNNLILIEDSAQAHGAKYGGTNVGSFGTGCFSFYPTKNMTTSEGGMITTDDEKVAERARIIRNHGMKRRYYHEMLGHNMRMTDINAAIGLEQLKKLDGFNARRRENATLLSKYLKDIEEITVPHCPDNKYHVFHQYTIDVPRRDDLIDYLKMNEIGTGIYYPTLITDQFGFDKDKNIIKAEEVKEKVLSLPVHPSVTKSDIEHISNCIGEFYD